jgi:hypothetical protein
MFFSSIDLTKRIFPTINRSQELLKDDVRSSAPSSRMANGFQQETGLGNMPGFFLHRMKRVLQKYLVEIRLGLYRRHDHHLSDSRPRENAKKKVEC